MSDTPRTDAVESCLCAVCRKWRDAMRPLERELAEAAEQVRRLRHELSEMTADRDSWEDQNSQRVDDALAAYKELDAEREKVRVLREALLAIFASDGSSGEYSTIRLADACEQARAALAATEPTP